MANKTTPTATTELTATIVSAYVSYNSVRSGDLAELIAAVDAALRRLGEPAPAAEQARPMPAVPIRKSVTPDHIISLEDGRHYKSLKKHLAKRGLSPAEYRTKWGLPGDYPMVAPTYAKRRSELAKSLGLGRKREEAAAPAAEEAPAAVQPDDEWDAAAPVAEDGSAEPVGTAAPKRKRRKKAETKA